MRAVALFATRLAPRQKRLGAGGPAASTDVLIVNIRSFAESLASSFGARPAALDTEVLRVACVEALADIPGHSRDGVLQRLDRLRRADDVSNLRAALFDLVSRYHGESIARQRIDLLDAKLRSG